MSNTLLSLSLIQTRFGGNPPISISEYYNGEGYINSQLVPTQGNAISFSHINTVPLAIQNYGLPHTCFRTNNNFHFNLNNIANWHANNSSNIAGQTFSNFYFYEYNNLNNIIVNINDGGNDMYDGGNFVTIQSECIGSFSNTTYSNIPYGNILPESTHGVYVSSQDTWPHFTFTYFQSDTVKLLAHGNTGSDGSGSVSNILPQTYTTQNGLSGDIWTCMNGQAGDPSIIDTWFTITKPQWSSVITLSNDQRKQSDDNDYSHYIEISGSNFVLCKVLFALSNGEYSDSTTITNFITNMVENLPLTVYTSNVSTPIRNILNNQNYDD